jgi:hypothetical protein
LFLVGLVLFHQQQRKISLDGGACEVRRMDASVVPLLCVGTKYLLQVSLCEQALTAMHVMICCKSGAKSSLQRRLLSFLKHLHSVLESTSSSNNCSSGTYLEVSSSSNFLAGRTRISIARTLHASGPSPCFSKCRPVNSTAELFSCNH